MLRNLYSDRVEERAVDQVVAEHGTLPNDELYFALKPQSTNLGEVDYYAMRDARPQALVSHAGGKFLLYRVGEAVASRNIHAAIYDRSASARIMMIGVAIGGFDTLTLGWANLFEIFGH
jgi:hypothetical protein